MLVKSLSFGFKFFLIMCVCSLSVSVLEIFSILGAPCFAVVGYTVFCSRFMSLAFSVISSMGLSPVSLLSVSLMLSVCPACAISWFRFSVVGILICFGFGK